MKFFICMLILLSAGRVGKESRRFFVVWNVGQGQWTTWIQEEECWHFDWGGEFFPLERARSVCGDKLNRIFLSHWDWDHVGGLNRARIFPRLCLARAPLGRSSARKEKLLPASACASLPHPLWEWSPASPAAAKKDSNARSRVFSNGRFLVEGDSPRFQEKKWAARNLPPVSILVLGHHGSRTSTSDFLLSRLPGLHQAVSSARWARYGHPHAETLARLRARRIPVLRTQDWGSLWFEM